MIIKYKLAPEAILKSETLKVCDEGADAMAELICTAAKVLKGRWLQVLMWVLTRFRKRTITNNVIEYDFYLLG